VVHAALLVKKCFIFYETQMFVTAFATAHLVCRLVAGLSPRSALFIPTPVLVGFVVEKVATGRGFSREYFGFPLSV
jgi:hypothetical protein